MMFYSEVCLVCGFSPMAAVWDWNVSFVTSKSVL